MKIYDYGEWIMIREGFESKEFLYCNFNETKLKEIINTTRYGVSLSINFLNCGKIQPIEKWPKKLKSIVESHMLNIGPYSYNTLGRNIAL